MPTTNSICSTLASRFSLLLNVLIVTILQFLWSISNDQNWRGLFLRKIIALDETQLVCFRRCMQPYINQYIRVNYSRRIQCFLGKTLING